MLTATETSYPKTFEVLPPQEEEAILRTLGHLALSKDDYFVIGGSNLVLREIKEATPDLDMLVSDDAFMRLKRRRGAEIKEPPLRARAQGADNKTIWVHNTRTPIPVSATTALGDGYYPMSFESHKDMTELVKGVPCLTLEGVRQSKEALQRPKDIEDLQAIAHYLGEKLVLPIPTVIDAFAFSS